MSWIALDSVAAWFFGIVLIVLGIFCSNWVIKRLPNTKNNLAPNLPEFPRRLRIYFTKYFVGYCAAAIFPGLVLIAILSLPELMLGRNTPVLEIPSDSTRSIWIESAIFVADQAIKGGIYDLPEIFNLSVTQAKIAEGGFVVKIFLFLYRILVSGFTLFMLLTLIDYVALKLKIPFGRDEKNRKKRLNLSGLARGEIITATDQSLRE
jgi:hypothetical protein